VSGHFITAKRFYCFSCDSYTTLIIIGELTIHNEWQS
jgi:hypothetical protein